MRKFYRTIKTKLIKLSFNKGFLGITVGKVKDDNCAVIVVLLDDHIS